MYQGPILSSVASCICQEGKSERTFSVFAFSSRFFLFFLIFSLFFLIFDKFFAVRGGTLSPGGGGALVIQVGYHPRKRTFKTHPKHIFFRYENSYPKYTFLHAFFFNLSVMSFPKFVMSKNIPFFPILHVFAPLNDVRAYIAWSWKNNPNYVNFFTRMISNSKNKWPPRALCPPDPPVATPLPILTVHTQFGNVRNGFHLISLYPQNSWEKKQKQKHMIPW